MWSQAGSEVHQAILGYFFRRSIIEAQLSWAKSQEMLTSLAPLLLVVRRMQHSGL